MDPQYSSSNDHYKETKDLPKLDVQNLPTMSTQRKPELVGRSRCSACEISNMIDSKGPSNCSSCCATKTSPDSLSPFSYSPYEHKVKRSRAGRASKLPLSALNTLQAWLDAHTEHPYPSAEVKKQLAQECGITEKQVTTWFTNARARQLSPLDTWLSSGSEDEGAKEEDIERAADSLANTGGFSYIPDTSNQGYMRAGSVVSASSIFSNGQARVQPSRRGKKKDYRRNKTTQISPISPLSVQPGAGANTKATTTTAEQELWQCTFCRQQLVPKSWRRHEETQHHTRAQWTCMLFGPRLSANTHTSRPNTSSSFCAFCMLKNPSEDHFLKHHRISECAKRPVGERTFFRPDHLRQHVKNYHTSTLHDIAQVKWKREGEDRGEGNNGWTCGFCGDHLETWNKRETHIANHFKEGMKMDQWIDYPLPTPTTKTGKKQAKKEDKETTEEKVRDHSHGFSRISRPFTRRSTRNSVKSIPVPTQPQEQTYTNAYTTMPATTPLTMGFAYSTAPVLPDINMDPLMGNAYTDFVDWSQMNQIPVQVPEPQYSSALVYDPSLQATFDLNALGGFGHNLDYQGPWNQHP